MGLREAVAVVAVTPAVMAAARTLAAVRKEERL
jgi:hypothetical protein